MKKKSLEKNSEVMDVVFLLDRSGSMAGSEADTIGGYNSYINSQRDNNVRVTTVLFDDKYEFLYEKTNIDKVKKLTKRDYFVRGCTALYDAIGKTINYLDDEGCKKVIFIINTDGMENASRKYNKAEIREMITGHGDWEFMFIGADIDSYDEGTSIGIAPINIANYEKSSSGISKLFGALSKASDMFYEDEELDDSWKDELK